MHLKWIFILEGPRTSVIELLIGECGPDEDQIFPSGRLWRTFLLENHCSQNFEGCFYWPTLFSDVFKEVSTCHECQIFEGKRKLIPLPLKLISIESPFQQWGLDFIGEINLSSSNKHKWILTTTNYFTKWVEEIIVRQATGFVVVDFLINNILSRFGCPKNLIANNAKVFPSHDLFKLCNDYNIILTHSTAYYPQGNGLAESSNKSLVRIIKNLL